MSFLEDVPGLHVPSTYYHRGRRNEYARAGARPKKQRRVTPRFYRGFQKLGAPFLGPMRRIVPFWGAQRGPRLLERHSRQTRLA